MRLIFEATRSEARLTCARVAVCSLFCFRNISLHFQLTDWYIRGMQSTFFAKSDDKQTVSLLSKCASVLDGSQKECMRTD